MSNHKVVSRDEWLALRQELLEKEKELTRQRDKLNEQRRELPWVKVEKNYVFDSDKGQVSLSDLFDGRSQLVVQHFMFNPDWEQGCVGCSFLADHKDAARVHLNQHDVSTVAISRAPLSKIEAFKKRMNWQFPWVSSGSSDFNYDYGVSFNKQDLANGPVFYNYQMQKYDQEDTAGTSVFYKNEAGEIFHTYSTYARGDESLLGAYNYLDLTPKGRNEHGAHKNLMDWVKHHDKY